MIEKEQAPYEPLPLVKSLESDLTPQIEMMNGVSDAYCRLPDGPLSLKKS